VWPVLLLLAGVIGAAVSARRGVAGAVAATGLTAASMVIAWRLSVSAPTNAYFSMFARVWELGLGAVLAFVAPAIKADRRVLTAMSWAGTAIVVVALLTTTSAHFPMPGALTACLGSALVLAGSGPAANPMLTNRAAVLVGDVSYSVYLTHFPIIVFAATQWPVHHGGYYLSICAVIAGASLLLYGLVERPVLERGKRVPRPVIALAAVLLVGGSATIYLGGAAYRTHAYAAATADTAVPSTLGPRGQVLAGQISAALRARRYPALRPSIAAEVAGPTAAADVSRCSVIALSPAAACSFGPPDAPHTLYLLGDSTAMVYAQAFEAMLPALPGWRIRYAGAFGCRFSAATFRTSTPKVEAGCAAHNAAVISEIQRARPDVVVVTNLNDRGPLLGGGRGVAEPEGVGFVEDALAAIRSDVGRIAFLANPPPSAVPGCYQPGSAPITCVSAVPSAWLADKAVLRADAQQHGEIYLDPRAWFCSAAGYCPAYVGTTPTFHSQNHASTAYLRLIWPVMLESMRSAGVF
jgi:hypothetical protein